MKTSCLLLLFMLIGLSPVIAQTISQLGFYVPLPSTFEGKYVNNHLLIAQQGLRVIDVTNANSPSLTGSATYPGSYAYQIAVSGSHAYMAEGGSGYFSVYDITNINSPQISGLTVIPSTSFMTGGDLIVYNNTAYMTGGDSLYVVDVSVPSAPALITSLAVMNPGFQGGGELAVHSNTLYLMTPLALNVYDISNAISPVYISGIMHNHGYNQGLAIDSTGNRLFATWKSSLQTHMGYNCFDIASAQSPIFLFADSITSSNGEFGLCAYWQNVLLVTESGSVNAFNVTSAANHSFISDFSGQNVANASVEIEIKDSVFYNIRGGGVEVLKLSNWPVGTTSLNQNVNVDWLDIYPNPAHEIISIELPEEFIPDDILVADASGRVFNLQFVVSDNELRTSVSDLAGGIYILKAMDKQHIFQSKLVVKH